MLLRVREQLQVRVTRFQLNAHVGLRLQMQLGECFARVTVGESAIACAAAAVHATTKCTLIHKSRCAHLITATRKQSVANDSAQKVRAASSEERLAQAVDATTVQYVFKHVFSGFYF